MRAWRTTACAAARGAASCAPKVRMGPHYCFFVVKDQKIVLQPGQR